MDRMTVQGRLRRLPRAGKAKAAVLEAPTADPAFRWGEVYSYPNPARRRKPIFHVEAGLADSIEIRLFDASGRLVHEDSLTAMPEVLNGRYVYLYTWDTSSQATGVYGYVVTARKGRDALTRTGKCAVIK